MPIRAPSICACGYAVPRGTLCACQRKRKAEADKQRPNSTDRGYDNRWQTERAAYLKVNKHCAFCGAPANLVDHIIPHHGNRALFWDRSNWQPLCTPCHSGPKQRIENARRKARGDQKSRTRSQTPDGGTQREKSANREENFEL